MVYYVEYSPHSHVHTSIEMKTIQMTIDEPLLQRVNRVAEELQTSRSAFIRDALEIALRRTAWLSLSGNMSRAIHNNRSSPVNLMCGLKSKAGTRNEPR